MRQLISIFLAVIILLFSISSGLHAGQANIIAPSFRLNDLSGQPVSLDSMRGKVVLLSFWAPWCVPCKDELPELDKLYKKYASKGLTIVGISVESSRGGVSSFLKKTPVTFPVVIDAAGHAAEAYRITGLPVSFLIDKKGFIYKRYQGFDKNSSANCETDVADLLNR
jgi:peroxiredoxin